MSRMAVNRKPMPRQARFLASGDSLSREFQDTMKTAQATTMLKISARLWNSR